MVHLYIQCTITGRTIIYSAPLYTMRHSMVRLSIQCAVLSSAAFRPRRLVLLDGDGAHVRSEAALRVLARCAGPYKLVAESARARSYYSSIE